MTEGWILLHKKMLSWEWYTDVNACKLFIHMLLKANYENKTWQGEEIKRGELISSREKLAAETGLTLQQTRTAEDKLKSTNNITINSTNKFTRYFIVKYEEYQMFPSEITYESTNNSTNEQQTNNKRINRPITTTKEVKERNKQKEKKESKEAAPDLFVDPVDVAPKIIYEWFSQVQTVFEEFKRLRKARKKPLTGYAEELALKELEKLRLNGFDPKAIIEQSIFRGWDGFFPIKADSISATPGQRKTFQQIKDEQQQAWIEEARVKYEQEHPE